MEKQTLNIKVVDDSLSEKEIYSIKISNQKLSENNSFLYELDKYQKAKKRKGLASCKNRSAVRGGGAKPYKQKGTGNARRGTNNTPLRRGGGVIFGPSPRDFEYKLDSNVIKYGYQELFNSISDNMIIINDSLLKSVKKTKEAKGILDKLNKDKNLKIVLIVEEEIIKTVKTWKNIDNITILNRRELEVNKVIHSQFVMIQAESIKKIEEAYFG